MDLSVSSAGVLSLLLDGSRQGFTSFSVVKQESTGPEVHGILFYACYYLAVHLCTNSPCAYFGSLKNECHRDFCTLRVPRLMSPYSMSARVDICLWLLASASCNLLIFSQ